MAWYVAFTAVLLYFVGWLVLTGLYPRRRMPHRPGAMVLVSLAAAVFWLTACPLGDWVGTASLPAKALFLYGLAFLLMLHGTRLASAERAVPPRRPLWRAVVRRSIDAVAAVAVVALFTVLRWSDPQALRAAYIFQAYVDPGVTLVPGGDYEGVWRGWYPNGRKSEEAMLVNGRYHGTHTLWYPDGTKKEERRYTNGHRDGVWVEWDECGLKRAEIRFAGGLPHGRSVLWHTNGRIEAAWHEDHGRMHGAETYWYWNGRKRSECHWRQGRRHGPWTCWELTGAVAWVRWYVNGASATEAEYRRQAER